MRGFGTDSYRERGFFISVFFWIRETAAPAYAVGVSMGQTTTKAYNGYVALIPVLCLIVKSRPHIQAHLVFADT